MRRYGWLVLALAVVAGCSGDPAPVATPSPSPSPTAIPTPTATRAPAPKPAPKPRPPTINPLTGRGGVPTRAVVAVKVDDTAAGRPQIGVEAADVVYVEEVEGGATRLVAVFASRQPATVGPVRSVRNNDPELLAAYGRPALAYSGGAAGPVQRLRRTTVVDAGPQRQGGAYRRLGSRPAPYNLVVDVERLGRTVRGASRVRDVGFRWAVRDARLATARRVNRVSVTVGRTQVDWRWDPRGPHWVQLDRRGAVRRTAAGRAVTTPNMVVPVSRTRLDPTNVDVLGTPSVYTSTVGSGRLYVFRDGRVLEGTWARSRPAGRTSYLDRARRPLTLRPGGAWVLLTPRGVPVRFR